MQPPMQTTFLRLAARHGAEAALETHRAAATLKKTGVGLAGRLQLFNGLRNFDVIGKPRSKAFCRSERTGYFRAPLVGILPVNLGDNLRQRLRGGCRFALRRSKCAVCANIANGERGDKCGKEN